MKKVFLVLIAAVFLVSAISAVSAGTIIAGKIYDSPNFETAGPVAGANINVTCDSNLQTAVSLSDGTYSVIFPIAKCPLGTTVTVVAEKDGFSNSGTGVVNDYSTLMVDLYIGVVNIALIPEFGLLIAGLTIVGAVGIFFIVRRK